MTYTYDYPRPSVTVDAVVFGYEDGELRVLLIERAEEPFAGAWALPGGFIEMEEDLDAAVSRELLEETGLATSHLEQLGAWGTPGRDPRGRTITIAYVALVKLSGQTVAPATDAADAQWFSIDEIPTLAFDHAKIVEAALARLREAVRSRPVGFDLLPQEFTLTELQTLVETVLGTELDKRNFRKKLQSLDLLIATGEYETGVSRRAAQLYRFDRNHYRRLERDGFAFRI